jgi:predicted nucleotidyltransferase
VKKGLGIEDLLADFEPDYSLIDRIGLMQDLDDLLGRKVDVVLEKNLRDIILCAIRY